jgi:inner membrane protein
MQLATYLLLSCVLARAARKFLPRYGLVMLVTAGVAAELDFVSYFAGPASFLKFHRTVLHSVVGALVMCCCIAGIYFLIDRSRRDKTAEANSSEFRISSALVVCLVGAAAHILLDLGDGIGVRLFWPFRQSWQAWDLLPPFDFWILVVLGAGLAIPYLGRLVSEEIGERKRGAFGVTAARVVLVMVVLYAGGRMILHSRATELLRSRDYRGEAPQNVGAFAASSNPFAWRGLVSTSAAIYELNISLLPGAAFDPEQAVPHYKPEESAAIAAAQNTADGKLFLNYARFPLAAIEPQDTGPEVTIRDLRFPAGDKSIENTVLDTRVDSDSRIAAQQLRFASVARAR